MCKKLPRISSSGETIPEYNLYTQQVMTIEYAARRCAENKEYNYLVFGHTHFPGIKGKIVNCGDFVDSSSYITIIGNAPSIHKI